MNNQNEPVASEATKSPLPTLVAGITPVPAEKEGLTFFDALKEVLNGKKISRHQWENKERYGMLMQINVESKETMGLVLHNPDKKFYIWSVSEGDLVGKDWFIL